MDTKKWSDFASISVYSRFFFVPFGRGWRPAVIFAVLTFKIVQIPEDSSNHE